MTDDLKQEFDAARIRHLLFKSKLRSFLYGSDTQQGPIRDPEQCAMGQWITQRALPAYGHLPETQELDRLHRLIHVEGSRLMDLHLAGQSDVATAGLGKINALAEAIVDLLHQIEARLRAS
ncbi:CZB domain-containing protein [Hymenobacter psychrophilus]|uniref:Chemoreceptor zinc-binding domain-containing protein n=1 Tax=Hymenobacter psychrophilus TaxID=651662 RepID=A0A1H3FNQ1_9BACT|nr:CZB domain-containing protein [Hymenobacter psychrophilus]SDX92581.1 Chemoreceptor zinc-binding domain-containing protein [Hymenobacter psychrophilus]